MKIPLSWLREFVEFDLDTKALCERLTMGGFEVEGVVEFGADIATVLIGEIVSTTPHPNSDRLTLCQVRDGESSVAVVCGATNMKAGDRVAFAPAGATLPGGRQMEQVEIRGVTSHGMLCSEAELGMSAESSGILILPPDAPLGQRVAAYLGVEDTVIDVAVTPNRGDCLSILGIAREVAALAGGRLLRGRIAVRERGEATSESIRIRIEDPKGCGRYAARLVRNVEVAPSPRWVQARLQAVGLRSINNVVDVTNLVMIERGQPLHAFDYDRLPGREVVVRRATDSERIRTLDGAERSLRAADLLISTGKEAIAIAGVMGGENTEVTATTRNVMLESAWFDPDTVRRTARRLELSSQAAYRFERGVDIDGVPIALNRAAALLRKLAAGEVAPGMVETYPVPHAVAPVRLRPRRVETLLGTSVGRAEIAAVLKHLGAGVSAAPHGALTVVPPSFRFDLGREIDLIEEVARLVGYDRIPVTMPLAQLDGSPVPVGMHLMRELKRVMAGQGLAEIVTLNFASAQSNEIFPGVGTLHGRAVGLLNPVNREESEMRRSLLGGLMAMWRLNRNQGMAGVAGFSVGKVFWQNDGAFCEGWRLAALLAGNVLSAGLASPTPTEFADIKGVAETVLERFRLADQISWQGLADSSMTAEIGVSGGRRGVAEAFHPGRTALLLRGDDLVGIVGALHPNAEIEFAVEEALWIFELDLEKLLPYVPTRPLFRGLPRYPAVARDLAVLVDCNFASDQIVRFVRDGRHGLIEGVRLFDEYIGAPIPSGKKSLAYTISYRAADRTLTDEEVNSLHMQLTDALRQGLGVEPR